MLKAGNVEILDLRKKLEEKEFEFNELKAAYQYKQEEVEKTQRINVILKARYEPENKVMSEYSPRALHETEFPNLRYSRVISLEDNNHVKRS